MLTLNQEVLILAMAAVSVLIAAVRFLHLVLSELWDAAERRIRAVRAVR